MVNVDDIDVLFNNLNNLYNQLCWEKQLVTRTGGQKVSVSVLSQYNDPNLLRKVEETYWKCYDPDIDKKIEENEDKATQIYYNLSGQASSESNDGLMEQAKDFRRTADKLRIYQKHLKKVKDILPRIQEILEPETYKRTGIQTAPVAKPTPPTLIIRKILEDIQKRDKNVIEVQKREQTNITNMLDIVGLTLDDDYSKFHSVENMNKITSYIQDLSVKNDGKRERIACLNKIVNYVCTMYPDFYKNNILMALPKLPRTARNERKPHLPYTKD